MPYLIIHIVEALTVLLIILAVFRIFKYYSLSTKESDSEQTSVENSVEQTDKVVELTNKKQVLDNYIEDFF